MPKIPAQRWSNARLLAEQARDELLQIPLDQRRRRLIGGVLVVERLVAEAAGDESAILGLLPVVVAVPGGVRAGEQAPLQRLGDKHLAARRPDRGVELRDEPLRVAVGRDHDLFRLERFERLDPLVLA